MNWYKRASEENEELSYRGYHKAPRGKHGEGSLSNMNATYPDDIYSREGARFYGSGHGRNLDAKAHSIIMEARGKPDMPVKIYRSVPKSAPKNINPGDWVTTVREYAQSHGERFEEGFDIVEGTARAGDLFTEGNSIMEYGWWPL